MSLTMMQIDMQQAIANGIRNYKAFYNSLIFNEKTKEYQGFFWYSDEIKIKIQDNKMLFEVTTDETKVNSLRNFILCVSDNFVIGKLYKMTKHKISGGNPENPGK